MADTLPSDRFSGRDVFRQLVRDALDCAAREGWREIILSDANFVDWPLGERAVVESLNAWAQSGRQMVLLAGGYEEVLRGQPRFVTWRRTWGHILDCRRSGLAAVGEFPSAIWSASWYLQRSDALHSIGVTGDDKERNVALKELLDECLRNSSPAFPASTLGL